MSKEASETVAQVILIVVFGVVVFYGLYKWNQAMSGFDEIFASALGLLEPEETFKQWQQKQKRKRRERRKKKLWAFCRKFSRNDH